GDGEPEDAGLGEGEEPAVAVAHHRAPLVLELPGRHLVGGAEGGVVAPQLAPRVEEGGERWLAAAGGEMADGAGGEEVREPGARLAAGRGEGERVEDGRLAAQDGEADLPAAALVPLPRDPSGVPLVEPARDDPRQGVVEGEVRQLVAEGEDGVAADA